MCSGAYMCPYACGLRPRSPGMVARRRGKQGPVKAPCPGLQASLLLCFTLPRPFQQRCPVLPHPSQPGPAPTCRPRPPPPPSPPRAQGGAGCPTRPVQPTLLSPSPFYLPSGQQQGTEYAQTKAGAPSLTATLTSPLPCIRLVRSAASSSRLGSAAGACSRATTVDYRC